MAKRKWLKQVLAVGLCMVIVSSVGAVLRAEAADAADKYNNFRTSSVKGPLIPGIGQGKLWVPQGLALVPDKNWMITSHYWDSEKSKLPSGIVITSTKTNERLKTLYLYESVTKPHTGNVGGVAVSKNHLWIASGYTIYKVPLSALADKKDNGRLIMTGYPVKHKASYATYADGVLWVGEYMDGKDNGKKTCGSGPNGRIFGYKLSASDDLSAHPQAASSRTTPDRIQGVALSNDRIVYSQSCGRDVSSKLIVYSRAVPGKKLGSATLPPMAEGIAFSGSQLYTLFESAAQKYKGGTYPLKNVYLVNMKKLKI